MSARQLIVLAIAAIAAIGALVLIRGMNAPKQGAETASAVVGEEVLVAARDIAQGAALTPNDLKVVAFPASAVTESFVRVSGAPSAQADYVGAVTRRAFVQGEPIIASAVVQPEGRGFMAAQLELGYRAVAVEIEASNAVGGYIQPNDHVDVIAALKVEGGDGNQTRSETIIEDARVLAVGDKTQAQTSGESPELVNAAVAVLELTPADARALAQAQRAGDISLALRGVQVETVGLQREQEHSLSQGAGAVRIHAFGTVTGGGQ